MFIVTLLVLLTTIHVSLLKKVYRASYDRFFNGELLSEYDLYREKYESSSFKLMWLAIAYMLISFSITIASSELYFEKIPAHISFAIYFGMLIVSMSAPTLVFLEAKRKGIAEGSEYYKTHDFSDPFLS